jgi:hypothetical protein
MKIGLPHPLSLFLLTLALVIVGLSLRFGVPAYRQWSAINNIHGYASIGGLLHETDARRAGPQWLRDLVGENRMTAFDEIEGLRFNPSIERHVRIYGAWFGPTLPVADDAVVANVRNLPSLKRLDLEFTDVSDIGMEQVCRLGQLEELDLSGTDVSDVSVLLLKRLGKLKTLSLRGTQITDSGVAELQQALPGLTITR